MSLVHSLVRLLGNGADQLHAVQAQTTPWDGGQTYASVRQRQKQQTQPQPQIQTRIPQNLSSLPTMGADGTYQNLRPGASVFQNGANNLSYYDPTGSTNPSQNYNYAVLPYSQTAIPKPLPHLSQVPEQSWQAY